jgi:phenylalanyl-tRNA synthetase alpha chain
MRHSILGEDALARALALRDLTDPSSGPHAIQVLVDELTGAIAIGHEEARIVRGARVVSVADNYDRLLFPPETVTRDARYTRYVSAGTVLRTHTSAMVPPALRVLARDDRWDDVVLVAPGVVYRRDCIDRLHTGEPHQVDVWRISRARVLGVRDLDAMIVSAAAALLPGRAVSTIGAVHPYTTCGRQIDIDAVEIGECGLAHPRVLAAAGLGDQATGLAMGIGLDRVLMLRKGIDDIRLLRSADPRVASQMLDLGPYRAVSSMPAIRRDLSIAVADATTAEEVGDRVRSALGARAEAVEEIAIVSETAGGSLPVAARERLGLSEGQKNVLVRVVLRDLARTLTHAEANTLRNTVYAALHEGSVKAWAT